MAGTGYSRSMAGRAQVPSEALCIRLPASGVYNLIH